MKATAAAALEDWRASDAAPALIDGYRVGDALPLTSEAGP